MPRPRSVILPSVTACLCAAASGAPPNIVRAIYTKIPKDPSARVPGARDAVGNPALTFFKAIDFLSVSPDGSQWCITGRTTQDATSNIVLLLGSGTIGSVLCQAGQPFRGGVAGEQYFFFHTPNPMAWNSAGDLLFAARARGGNAATAQKVVRVVGGAHSIIHEQSGAALGLIDDPPAASGNETFGQNFTSLFLFNNGVASFRNSPINNCAPSRYPAIFHGNTSFRQAGVSTIDGESWDYMDTEGAGGTPDGAHWFASGAVSSPDTFTDDILVVDNHIVLREGSEAGAGGQAIAHFFFTRMAANGDWISRGDDFNGGQWVVRNGVNIAQNFGTIVPGNPEYWWNSIYAFAGNARGHWVVVGNTSADGRRDEVIAFDGRKVVVREGDPVDVNGNGLADDDAFIGRGDTALRAFSADNCFLTDDLVLYFIASLHNSAGQDLNTVPVFGPPTALLRVQLYCPADYNQDGFVDGIDYDQFNNDFEAGNMSADYNGDGFVDGIDSDQFNADFEAGC